MYNFLGCTRVNVELIGIVCCLKNMTLADDVGILWWAFNGTGVMMSALWLGACAGTNTWANRKLSRIPKTTNDIVLLRQHRNYNAVRCAGWLLGLNGVCKMSVALLWPLGLCAFGGAIAQSPDSDSAKAQATRRMFNNGIKLGAFALGVGTILGLGLVTKKIVLTGRSAYTYHTRYIQEQDRLLKR